MRVVRGHISRLPQGHLRPAYTQPTYLGGGKDKPCGAFGFNHLCPRILVLRGFIPLKDFISSLINSSI